MRAALWCSLLLAGCGGPYWSRLHDTTSESLPPGQRIQVWHGGEMTVLTQVRVTSDSVIGWQDCGGSADERWLRYARAEVDSLRQSHDPGAGGIILGGVAGAIAMLLAITASFPDTPT